METGARVILVHGAFHGAWCWQEVIDHLRERNVEAVAVDLPGCGSGERLNGGLEDCAKKLREVIEGDSRPAVVCGHSLGGVTITEGVDSGGLVKHLVYLAALVPDVGETALNNAPEIFTGEISRASRMAGDGGVIVDSDAAGEIFYHDCDPEIRGWAVSRLSAQNPQISMTPLTQAAWRYCDSTYIVCQDDRALPVDVQERLAVRCRNVVRIGTSHSPMLSRPEKLSEILAELAA